ncbi:MAG: hypothetical protein WEA04_03300 [Candidatus Andersenbacteria bacterium]
MSGWAIFGLVVVLIGITALGVWWAYEIYRVRQARQHAHPVGGAAAPPAAGAGGRMAWQLSPQNFVAAAIGIPAYALYLAVVIFVLLVLSAMICGMGGCAMHAFSAALGATKQAGTLPEKPEELPPLSQEQRRLVTDRFLDAPVGENAWRVSPQEDNLYYDRQRPGTRYVMNLTYMDSLEQRITAGRTGTSTVLYRVVDGGAWQYVRPTAHLAIPPGSTCLHIEPTLRRWPATGSDQYVGLYWRTRPPSDGSVVIQTETLVNEGTAAIWGPLLTQLDDRPLKWEMTIVMLDEAGNYLPLDRFGNFPPLLTFVTEDGARVVHVQACYEPVTLLTHASEHVSHGRQLALQIPDGFGNASVTVSFKVH